MKELISIIIPTYNRKDTILKCINSVTAQTYSNIEIIVVDDASTDGTFELFQNNNDSRIKFYRYEENQGACYARNYGVQKSNGEFIAFQDSDDEWLPEKLEKQLNYLKQNNADFCFCGMNRTDENMKKFYYPKMEFYADRNAFNQLLVRNCISTQTMIMKKSVFDKVNFDVSFKRFQDWDFSLQVALNEFCIVYLKEALIDSGVSDNSISINANTRKAYVHIFRKYQKYYRRDNHAFAIMLANMANANKNYDNKKAIKFLLLSFKKEKNIKILIKIILAYLNLWK